MKSEASVFLIITPSLQTKDLLQCVIDDFQARSDRKYVHVTWYVFLESRDAKSGRSFMDGVVRPTIQAESAFMMNEVPTIRDRPRDATSWILCTTAKDLFDKIGNAQTIRTALTKRLRELPVIQVLWFDSITVKRLTKLEDIGHSANLDKTRIKAQLKRTHDKEDEAKKVAKRHVSLLEGLKRMGATPQGTASSHSPLSHSPPPDAGQSGSPDCAVAP